MSHVGGTESVYMIKLTIGEAVYITKHLLSDHSSCDPTTRVWEAYREDDHERTSVAIKDVWMPADAIPEGSQLLELHQKLRILSHLSPEQYFLTGFRSNLPDGLSEGRRKHYRIVFKEVGTPIYKLRCVSEVMRALADATRALQLLYQLGLVHRDVSAGNILLVDGVGKLTDLKFMRSYRGPINPSSPADRYIRTANFTAGEVAAAWYAYASKAHGAKHFSEDPPFRFNPFHDVESTLWIGIYILFHHLRDVPEVKDFSQVHFPYRFTKMTAQCRTIAVRCGFFSLGESHPFHAVLEVLHDVRFDLYRRYMLFESDFPNQYRFLEDEMVPLIFLERARTDTSKRKATTAPATPEPPAKKLKRTSS
ncbi:hypothetical protein R3P38DRAFT_3284712 [Favolaschia claudopus]|uniref:Fungal-type protein kinase domain-containing protein n=1 Tax=Favolaschia claudopus TaxID=2862362 RepID=A0AAW0A522_9AGAR